MEIIPVKPTGFCSNCFILCSAGDAFVVDPSVSEKKILAQLSERNLKLCGILLTHGHFDHIWRADQLRDASGAPLYVHELDAEMLTDPHKNAYATFTGGKFTVKEADVLIREGDILTLGDEKISVLHTPGHTRGSVCFDTGDSLISGDTLFSQGFGRYDLYGGSLTDLKKSLERLMQMSKSESRWLYPGHGEPSTLRSAAKILSFYF